jgi:GTPase
MVAWKADEGECCSAGDVALDEKSLYAGCRYEASIRIKIRMSDIDDFLQEFPESSRQILLAVWESLPVQHRQDLLEILPLLAGRPGKIQKLFDLSRSHLAMSFGAKHNVVIVGPANVGKSTLYNQLIQSKEDRAAVSPVPGTTRTNQEASAGPFTVVDTPGADAVGEVGLRERQLALSAASEADFLIIIFDAVQGVKRTERELFQELIALGKPHLVVVNKMDLVRGAEEAVVTQMASHLDLQPSQIIPVVATERKNLERVILAVVKTEPALVAALGRGLPGYRWQLAWRLIIGAATTSALVALTPMPFLDFIPLVGIQASLILGIARIYNYPMNLGRWREVISVFGMGFLGRTLFYELIKFGGPPAWVVSSAVAAGTTVTIGYGAILWFERGERLSRETLQQISRSTARNLLGSLGRFVRRGPSRKALSETISEAVDRLSLPENTDSVVEGTRLPDDNRAGTVTD